MRLASLTIEKFRSITKAYKLPLSDSTVLIGPNNEGKSNVLRALVLAMRALLGRLGSGSGRFGVLGARSYREPDYDWERDFPVHLQGRRQSDQSVFVLEFALTAQELVEFRSETRSKSNGTLPLRIAIGRDGKPQTTVHKQGRGATLSKKTLRISEFIAARVELQYIPAVRTAESARQVVDTMVARELAMLEEDPEYRRALARIEELQQPVLDALSSSIQETLKKFLPAVKSVEISALQGQRFEALRRCDIHVDDGSRTELRYKGDGVQSLAALGLMRHASAREAAVRATIELHETGVALAGLEDAPVADHPFRGNEQARAQGDWK
jgi:putative ATP-dependent endonuclease of OLD family